MINNDNLLNESSESVSPSADKTLIPKVMGILLIVFGSIYMIWGIFMGIMTLVMSNLTGSFSQFAKFVPKLGQTLDFDALMEIIRTINIVQGSEQITAGIISVFALVSGIGLVQYKEWGLKIATGWAIAAIVYIMVHIGIYFGVVMPAFEEYSRVIIDGFSKLPQAQGNIPPSSAFTGMMSITGITGTFVLAVILAVMPVLTLVFMFRQNVKNSLE